MQNTNKKKLLENDDPRFRVKPYQQMLSSCTGGVITSLISKNNFVNFFFNHFN